MIPFIYSGIEEEYLLICASSPNLFSLTIVVYCNQLLQNMEITKHKKTKEVSNYIQLSGFYPFKNIFRRKGETHCVMVFSSKYLAAFCPFIQNHTVLMTWKSLTDI
jgi:hypothetical protein